MRIGIRPFIHWKVEVILFVLFYELVVFGLFSLWLVKGMKRSIQRKYRKRRNPYKAYVKYFWSVIVNILYEFAAFTSLHGIKNIIGDFKSLDEIHAKLSKRYFNR